VYLYGWHRVIALISVLRMCLKIRISNAVLAIGVYNPSIAVLGRFPPVLGAYGKATRIQVARLGTSPSNANSMYHPAGSVP
jgi:hypothetical protein